MINTRLRHPSRPLPIGSFWRGLRLLSSAIPISRRRLRNGLMGEDVSITMLGIGWFTGPFCVLPPLINLDWNDTMEGDTETRRKGDTEIADGVTR